MIGSLATSQEIVVKNYHKLLVKPLVSPQAVGENGNIEQVGLRKPNTFRPNPSGDPHQNPRYLRLPARRSGPLQPHLLEAARANALLESGQVIGNLVLLEPGLL